MSENGSNNAREIWALDENIDERICDVEASHVRAMDTPKDLSYLVALRLAFQSLGVIYGDLSTSPLYVFNTIFPENIPDQEEVMGALSLIIYSLTLFPLIKYVFVVIRANDHGEGGTFAIYSLLCRHVKVNDIPNQHPTDKKLTAYRRNSFKDKSVPARIIKFLEDKVYCQKALLIVVLIGTCMIIGDGVFTPSVSVLSSIVGINTDHREMSTGIVVIVATAILVILFGLQHYGTNKVGWLFAPVVLLWLLSIGAIGAYNVIHYDLGVLKAFSPLYVYRYFKKDSKHSWLTLGGIMICITGSETIFADLGHFSTSSVQIAFTAVVFPCLLLQYMGQAAYIIKHPFDVKNAFYSSIPAEVYWPIFCIATLASVIASQASITATFSIIKQSVALGCFPRVKVLHTSNDISGQIYIPEINWILMVLCVIVVAGFQNTTRIANAYGFSVIVVMLVTTLLMALVMLIVWRTHWFFVLLFMSFFLPIEFLYFSSALFKIVQGAWLPLVFAAVFLTIMYVWHYGTVKKYEFEMSSKVSVAWLVGLGPSFGLVRVPGVGLVYTELVKGVPHIFSHLVTHLPAIHSVVVFVCIKFLPVHRVSEEERFLVKRIGPKEFGMFRCVARYGYKDLHKKDDSFERELFEALSSFVRNASLMENFSDSEQYSYCEESEEELDQALGNANTVSSDIASATMSQNSTASAKPYPQTNRPIGFLLPRHETVDDEIQQLKRCWDAGVVHVLGNTQIMARKESNVIKKIAIDYIYAFLRRVCRENSVIFNIPQESLLNVGQICCV